MASSTTLMALSITLATAIAVVYDHHSNNTHPMVEHRVLHDGTRQEEKNKKLQGDGGGGTAMLNVRRRFSASPPAGKVTARQKWRDLTDGGGDCNPLPSVTD
ncbi:unnamed protein product [Lactuca saligna]|uniref:Uncharacterized protein n=1 Tax=Lactuca saligna TaxID=75948 RepID=A0AA35Z3Z7_LACSI|nr:unnamed protein product [Lactuca saligna]